jgi:hypothetical protein
MPTKEPIALIHWGDPAVEAEEIEEVQLLLEATLFNGDQAIQAKRSPRIAHLRLEKSDVKVMSAKLTAFISAHSNLQVIYFSCHGNSTSLVFAKSDGSEISYVDFVTILRRAFRDHGNVHIVLGSCEAMSALPHVETLMPPAVCAVSGFTCCPSPNDVAGLIASIIQDDVTLIENLTEAKQAVCRTGIPFDKFGEVIERCKVILDQHTEDPSREVLGIGGGAIVQATRDPETGCWCRRTWPCT